MKEQWYGIKIDLRKKNLIVDPIIWRCIANNELWVDQSEGNYAKKNYALWFSAKELAQAAITEEYEMVCKI